MIGYGVAGTSHDFYCFDSSGNVWNGSSFVAWSDGDYASYRLAATEKGTSGRFNYVFSTPSGTLTYELRERGASLATSYIVWTGEIKIAEQVWNAAQSQHITAGTLGRAVSDIGGNLATSLTNQSTIGTNVNDIETLTNQIKAKTDLIGTIRSLIRW